MTALEFKGNNRENTHYQLPQVPIVAPIMREIPYVITPKPEDTKVSEITHYNFEEYEI